MDIQQAFNRGYRFARAWKRLEAKMQNPILAQDSFWVTMRRKDGSPFPVLLEGEPDKSFVRRYGPDDKGNVTRKRVESFIKDDDNFGALIKIAEAKTEKEKTALTERFKKNLGFTDEEINEFLEMRKQWGRDKYPKEIAGVSRGSEMSHDEADGNKPNPSYQKIDGARQNCQAAVVAYEMRRRGYDVESALNDGNGKLEQLSRETYKAWLDKDGNYAKIIVPEKGAGYSKSKIDELGFKATVPTGYYGFLDDTIKKGERYNLGFRWADSGKGHIVTVFKDDKGKIIIYDPQSNHTEESYNKSINFLRRIRLKGRDVPDLYRVDNLGFNPYFINDIIIKKGNKDGTK